MGREESGKKKKKERKRERGRKEEAERKGRKEGISKNKIDQRQVTPKKCFKSLSTCPHGLFMTQSSNNHTLIAWTAKICY